MLRPYRPLRMGSKTTRAVARVSSSTTNQKVAAPSASLTARAHAPSGPLPPARPREVTRVVGPDPAPELDRRGNAATVRARAAEPLLHRRPVARVVHVS